VLGALVASTSSGVHDPYQYGLYIYCFFCLVAYSLLTPTFAFIHVAEREHYVKYLLKVSGCRPLPYWVGTFLADVVLAILIWGLMIGIAFLSLKDPT
jgi:ATP-binding cassette subfamily A (ABC1) protein 3